MARYQFQGSSQPQGIRLNSRYARRADSGLNNVAFNFGGRGDRHHSFYLGLNTYL